MRFDESGRGEDRIGLGLDPLAVGGRQCDGKADRARKPRLRIAEDRLKQAIALGFPHDPAVLDRRADGGDPGQQNAGECGEEKDRCRSDQREQDDEQ